MESFENVLRIENSGPSSSLDKIDRIVILSAERELQTEHTAPAKRLYSLSFLSLYVGFSISVGTLFQRVGLETNPLDNNYNKRPLPTGSSL